MNRFPKEKVSILVMIILAISFTNRIVSVNAIGTPNVSDTMVHVGDTILVFGAPNDVTSGSEVKVYWDIASGSSAWILNTTTGNPDGSYELEIMVPDTPSGAHYIWIEDVPTGNTVKSNAISVSPKLEVDPGEGLPGDTLTIMGTGFDDSEQFNVSFFNSTTKAVVVPIGSDEETDAYGSFTVAFDVPSGWSYGDYWINVTDGTNNNITVDFTIKSAIILTHAIGPEGSIITINGRGFTPNQLLTMGNVSWNGPPGVTGYPLPWVIDPIINGSGEFTGEIVAPSWGLGSWRVQVFDGNVWAEDNFTIDGTTSISINPTYGPPGTSISVEGNNFPQIAGTDIDLTLNGTALSTVDSEADGTWNATFTVPAVQFGQYLVNASSYPLDYHVNATVEFMVGAAFYISSSEGSIGSEVTLYGAGFSAEFYNLSLGEYRIITNGDVSPSSNISLTFVVPEMIFSTYLINVTDGIHWFTLPFTIIPNKLHISINAPNNVSIGSIVEIDGFLHWDNGTRLADTHLVVRNRFLFGTEWDDLSVVQSDVNGSFKMQWIPTATGEYRIWFDLGFEYDTIIVTSMFEINVTVSDFFESGFQLNLSTGWNMVSSFDRVASADEVFPEYYQLVTWNGAGYVSVDIMEPGKGYWALVLEDTSITISG